MYKKKKKNSNFFYNKIFERLRWVGLTVFVVLLYDPIRKPSLKVVALFCQYLNAETNNIKLN